MTDRHPKWVPVEPGIVIPAGQPHRRENPTGRIFAAVESVLSRAVTVESESRSHWFIDSSWRPPLELPTEATWGIAVVEPGCHADGPIIIGSFYMEEKTHGRYLRWSPIRSVDVENVLELIPLTDEQVARIEAHK